MDGYYDDYDDSIPTPTDLLTNFPIDELPRYKEAIEKFGDKTLYVVEEAFDICGRELKNYYSLRTTMMKDRGNFWKLFDELKDN